MKSVNRRSEILNTFEKLVEQYGIDKTTMHDVAREMKVSVGLLYTEFSGKDELVEGLLDRIHENLIVSTKYNVIHEGPVEEKLYEIILGHIEKLSHSVRRNQAVHDFISGILPTKYLRKKIEVKRSKIIIDLTTLIETVLIEGVQKGVFKITDIKQTARLIFDAFEVYRFPPFMMEKDHETLMEEAKKMFKLILKALKNPD